MREPSELICRAVVRSEIVRQWIEALHAATGLTVKLLPADPAVKVSPLATEENPFCALATRARVCLGCAPPAAIALGQPAAPTRSKCRAGMIRLAVPVVVNGQHVATLYAGQVLDRRPTPRQFARLVKPLVPGGPGSTPASLAPGGRMALT